jgi:heat shock protein HtpX
MNFVRTMLLLAAMTALFMAVGYLIGGTGGMLIALIFAAGTNAFAYWNSDKLALRMHNAEPVTPANAPELYEMVGRLARNAGIPTPRVFLIRSDQPNAFATGRNPDNAAVAATTGILQVLDRAELEGVIAHELAHIRNRDMLLQTFTATMAGAISMLGNMALFMGRSDDEGHNPMAGLLMAILGPIAAMIIQAAISRQREFKADRVGAEISGKPMPLANALLKLDAYAKRIPMDVAPSAAPLAVVNPLQAFGGGMATMFSTHPRTEDRVAALRAMSV